MNLEIPHARDRKFQVPVIVGHIQGLALPTEIDREYATRAFFDILGENSFAEREAIRVLRGTYHPVRTNPKMLADVFYSNHGARDMAGKVVARSLKESEGQKILDFFLLNNLFRSSEFGQAYTAAVSPKINLEGK